MQVDPIKPTLKPPGTKRLQLQYHDPPSNSAFKFSLRRYSLVARKKAALRKVNRMELFSEAARAGAYTRPHFSSS